MVTTAASRLQLVVIGCSAGGIEALSSLFSTLRTPFPAPIAIAQHLAPNRPSHLAEVLSRRSTLPVRTITGRVELEAGIIYVVPPDRHVEVTDQHIQLMAQDGERPKPSVDILFRSAAEAFGENLIAVILTGTGSDGSAGAREVKKHGGTVLIENPDTASFPGMPESLAPTTVDIVADLDRIGPLLYNLLTGAYVEASADEEKALQLLLDLVRERSGIDFKKYKQATIQRRLRRRIVATDTGTTEHYIHHLEGHPEEYQRLINSFLIKVTEFMRDPDLFAYLKESILPELIEHARHEDKTLRIWSAGCATGEEAYSLAMLLSEILGNSLADFNIRIFSTDVDSDAIAFARHGSYTPSSVEDMPTELVERYFIAIDGHYQIKKRIRNLTVFGEHDLGQRAPFPHIDLVVCRNVLIYFTGELQRRTLQLFAFSLRDSGYLVLGKAETTSPLSEFFVPHEIHHKVYIRRGERVLIPPSRVGPPVQRRALREKATSPIRPQRETPRIRLPIDTLLTSVPHGIVIVDSQYDIQEINFAARRMLSIHGPAVGQDFVHLAHVLPHAQLLSAIDDTLGGEAPPPFDVAIEPWSTHEPRHIRIGFYAQDNEGRAQKRGAVLILISDVTTEVEQRKRIEALAVSEAEYARLAPELAALLAKQDELTTALSREEAARQEDRAAIERLTDTNRRLVRANEELTAAHEQLRGANEELLLSSEEAQAATEEVETLNEEFQATNEELETVNEELQSTIEELNTTNADLEARSREIQELAGISESERTRLSAILRSIGDALLVVDRAGKSILTNEVYQQMFGDSRVALTDELGRPLRREDTPEQRAARGEKFQMEFAIPGPAGKSRHFEATGHPSPSTSLESNGGVIVIRDITDRSLRKLQDRFMAMASHELRTPLVPLHGYLDMLIALLKEQGGDERLRRFAVLARSQGERLEGLVDDLVSAARMQTGKFELKLEPLELGQLVKRAVELATVTSAVPPIELDGSPEEPMMVLGDGPRLEQVMMNLLNNAILHASASPRIDLRLKRAGEEAQIEVEDYGPGIPAADLPYLFSNFYQVERADRPSRGGMGLGLYISQEIVKAHQGRIDVRSTDGKGTVFTVRLPLGKTGGTLL